MTWTHHAKFEMKTLLLALTLLTLPLRVGAVDEHNWFTPAPDGSQCLKLPQSFSLIGTVSDPAEYVRKSDTFGTKVGVTLMIFSDNGRGVFVETVMPAFPISSPIFHLFFSTKEDCDGFNLNTAFKDSDLQ